MIRVSFEASGIAAPIRQATLSTKLMGTVLSVAVREGEVVAEGQVLVRIDARDLAAKAGQVAASIAEAEAMLREARAQTGRIRALYTDSAATKSQLDAAEAGLARADAGVRSSRAADAELGAVSAYAVIRAPFAGTITKRFVDPGALAAPGAPLIAIQDGRQLRIAANATPDAARNVRRGQRSSKGARSRRSWKASSHRRRAIFTRSTRLSRTPAPRSCRGARRPFTCHSARAPAFSYQAWRWYARAT